MMHNLCRKSPPSLYGVDRAEYQRLQGLVLDTIADAGIYRVHYDDINYVAANSAPCPINGPLRNVTESKGPARLADAHHDCRFCVTRSTNGARAR